jgi:DeoR/GlpR family transcriptional regulator of sugar metabolism
VSTGSATPFADHRDVAAAEDRPRRLLQPRQEVAVSGKQRVAAAAAALVEPDTTVILDGGTTALAVVHALSRDLRATVITHSPTVASALGGHPDVEVYLIGGRCSLGCGT